MSVRDDRTRSLEDEVDAGWDATDEAAAPASAEPARADAERRDAAPSPATSAAATSAAATSEGAARDTTARDPSARGTAAEARAAPPRARKRDSFIPLPPGFQKKRKAGGATGLDFGARRGDSAPPPAHEPPPFVEAPRTATAPSPEPAPARSQHPSAAAVSAGAAPAPEALPSGVPEPAEPAAVAAAPGAADGVGASAAPDGARSPVTAPPMSAPAPSSARPLGRSGAPVSSRRASSPVSSRRLSLEPAGSSQLIYTQASNPTGELPIVYRERAFAVDGALGDEELKDALKAELGLVREEIRRFPQVKYVQLALFDHKFHRQPSSPPLATLSWKDWQNEPEVWVRGIRHSGPEASEDARELPFEAIGPTTKRGYAPAPSEGAGDVRRAEHARASGPPRPKPSARPPTTVGAPTATPSAPTAAPHPDAAAAATPTPEATHRSRPPRPKTSRAASTAPAAPRAAPEPSPEPPEASPEASEVSPQPPEVSPEPREVSPQPPEVSPRPLEATSEPLALAAPHPSDDLDEHPALLERTPSPPLPPVVARAPNASDDGARLHIALGETALSDDGDDSKPLPLVRRRASARPNGSAPAPAANDVEPWAKAPTPTPANETSVSAAAADDDARDDDAGDHEAGDDDALADGTGARAARSETPAEHPMSDDAGGDDELHDDGARRGAATPSEPPPFSGEMEPIPLVSVRPPAPERVAALEAAERALESAPDAAEEVAAHDPAGEPAERAREPEPADRSVAALIDALSQRLRVLSRVDDVVLAAELVLSALDEVIPTAGAIVHLFEPKERSFVAVRARGRYSERLVGHRTRADHPRIGDALHEACTVQHERGRFVEPGDSAWRRLGVEPAHVLTGPVLDLRGTLGLIELADPLAGGPFQPSELEALDFACERFAGLLLRLAFEPSSSRAP